MSKLRPECGKAGPGDPPSPEGLEAYLQIYAAVEQSTGLGHGHLHTKQGPCAIGAYFDLTNRPMKCTIIDEVAAINDAVPTYHPSGRRGWVLRWLKWKLARFGYHVGRGRPAVYEPTVGVERAS